MIDAPFDVRLYHVTLKQEKRLPPVVGPVISVVADKGSLYQSLTDGSGLANRDKDRLLEHSTNETGMWLCDTDKIKDGIVFDLQGERMLESIAVWNYNKAAYTDRGVGKVDVSVWTEQGGWKTVLKDAALQEAEGTDDYDEPTLLMFNPVLAKKVRFENMKPFNAKIHQIGLSEVCFNEPLGAAACNPYPADGSQVPYLDAVPLAWIAGKGAIVHDVYVGPTQESLQFLGRVKGPAEVTVSGLSAGKAYFWRVDEVDKDGVKQSGPVWSLTTRNSLIAHWKLDETEGTAVSDSSGNNHGGHVQGKADWRSSEGAIGGAMFFDGASYVDAGDIKMSEPVIAMTIAAWIKVNAFDKEYQSIAAKGTDSWRLLRNRTEDALHFGCDGLDKTLLSGKTSVNDKQWHHVAGVYDGTTMSLYVDGQLDSSQSNNGSIQQDDQPVYIGATAQKKDREWNGMIDDVRIYEQALTAEQIQQLGRRQEMVVPTAGKIHLVDAKLVKEGQSLKDIAEEINQQPDGKKSKNLTAVVVIILVIVVLAAVSAFRKKK